MQRWVWISAAWLGACAGASNERVEPLPEASGTAAEPEAESTAPSASESGPWPDRICVAQKAGRAQLVFENDCGCNEALVCSASFDPRAKAIRVALSVDLMQGPFCRDCFAMAPGECDVPKLPANAALTLLINDVRAISVETDARATLPVRCWDTGSGRNR